MISPVSQTIVANRAAILDNSRVKPLKTPMKLGPIASLLISPLLLVALALALPYNMIVAALYARRERKFQEEMRISGRTIEFDAFVRELSVGNGTLIVERFSFEGPIRRWWIAENFYERCPFTVVDWLAMTKDDKFADSVEWCSQHYTGAEGRARLVLGNKEQWKAVRGDSPMTFRDDVRWVEMPPPKVSS